MLFTAGIGKGQGNWSSCPGEEIGGSRGGESFLTCKWRSRRNRPAYETTLKGKIRGSLNEGDPWKR